ncbi:Glutamine amidotransferase type 1 [Penicillium italicum]|uniref:CTP synthase n=1 Tax=Penicillium italicum TaxID=40296 RepID=A0A0A2KRG2_PENIT|nr:Glutamine amidotransferase type 1 [Penicillium italicum]
MKYIVVSGGVISGAGKGIVASSAGLLLQSKGFIVTTIKIDPYINIDSGTMSPLHHGEIYVTDDGGEINLDLGNFERYLSTTLQRGHNITTGKIYQDLISRERAGDYLGKTVQVVPHLTNAIQEYIERTAKIPVDESQTEPDVCIIELGGTVGDIESSPFIYALAHLRKRVGKENLVQIHVTYVPIVPPGASGEQKTKPTQRSVSDVRSAGLSPFLVACRCEVPLDPSTIQKIANMCSMEPEQVISVHNCPTTYHVPLILEKQNLLGILCEHLNLPPDRTPTRMEQGKRMWNDWVHLIRSQDTITDTVSIALVGKYTSNKDAYLSVSKSIEHAAMYCHKKVKVVWIDAAHLEDETYQDSAVKYHKAWHDLCSVKGIIVPGGFGARATGGMIKAITWARIKKKPFLGVCLGMQLAVVEYARYVMGIPDAGSQELHPESKNHVIIHMPEHNQEKGPIRLGKHPCIFREGTEWSKLRKLYGPTVSQIEERHRNQYEINPGIVEDLDKAGLAVVSQDPTGKRVEIVELRDTDHPFFVGVQFHPEYLSRVLRPSNVFLGFFAAAAKCLEKIPMALQQGQRSLVGRSYESLELLV